MARKERSLFVAVLFSEGLIVFAFIGYMLSLFSYGALQQADAVEVVSGIEAGE